MYTAENFPKIVLRTQYQDQATEKIFFNYFFVLFCLFPLEKKYTYQQMVKFVTQEKCADLFLLTENVFWNEVDSYR